MQNGDKGGTSSAAHREDWGFTGTVKMRFGGLWEGNQEHRFEGKERSMPMCRGSTQVYGMGMPWPCGTPNVGRVLILLNWCNGLWGTSHVGWHVDMVSPDIKIFYIYSLHLLLFSLISSRIVYILGHDYNSLELFKLKPDVVQLKF